MQVNNFFQPNLIVSKLPTLNVDIKYVSLRYYHCCCVLCQVRLGVQRCFENTGHILSPMRPKKLLTIKDVVKEHKLKSAFR